MRLLADENVPGDAVRGLRERGHDVKWVHEVMPGVSDLDVLEHARSDSRILLTFDKDFGELVFRHLLPAGLGVILFRLSLPSPAFAAEVMGSVIDSRTDWEGHFAVVYRDRVRLVRLPSSPAPTK